MTKLTLQKRHERVGRVCVWKVVRALRIEVVCDGAPVHGQAVDGVGHDVHRRTGGDEVASEMIIVVGSTDGHGDGADTAE